MNVLVLAVFLTIPQASPPIPRKAADSAISVRQTVQDKTKHNQAPIAAPPPVNSVGPGPTQGYSAPPKSVNTEQVITVSKFPAVSVHRDWADWVLWVFSGLLVIAGFLGIRVAYKTLKKISEQTEATKDAAKAAANTVEAINKQVGIMERQTKVAEDAVAAAKESASAAFLNAQAVIHSERAWIMVSLTWSDRAGNILHGEGASGQCTHFSIDVVCSNQGKTPGWILRKYAKAQIGRELPPRPVFEPRDLIQIEVETIAAGEIHHKRDEVICPGFMRNGLLTAIYGRIVYRDIFSQEERSTTFGYYVSQNGGLDRIPGLPEYNQNT